MKNGEETAKKFFIVVLEILTARETKLLSFCQLGKISPKKVVSNKVIWKKVRGKEDFSAVEVEGGVGGGRICREVRGLLILWGERSSLTQRGLGLVMETSLWFINLPLDHV